MIKNKELEKLEHSSVKLTLTIEKEAVRKEYDSLLKKYTKTAQLKGFRKGKVPVSVLEQKFGDSIRAEASMNTMDSGLKEAMEDIEERPLPYHTPELQEELEFDLEKDLTFTVHYDIYPEIKLGNYKGLEVEVPDPSITKTDTDRELKSLQDQNALVVDKKEGTVEKDNIVTIDYVELDENKNEKPGTNREGFVFTVGSGYNLYKLDDDIIGMAKDEEKVVEKEFPEDYEIPELKGKKVAVKVKVTVIKEKQLPELDDELAKDISEKYETLEDLKKDLKAKLKEAANTKIREKKITGIMDQIVENSPIDLPESMINAELEASWRNFVAQFRAREEDVIQLIEEQGRSKEKLMEEWRPSTEIKIKNRLLMNEIIEQEKIEVTDDEIEEEIKRQADLNNTPLEDVQKRYENNSMKELLRSDIKDKKLFDFLIGESTIKKGKKVKFLDLMQDNQ